MMEKSTSDDRILQPRSCSADQLGAFAALVLQGGQVRPDGLRDRIARAHWLAFHYDRDELAGIAAVKRPSVNYRDNIFFKAQATSAAEAFNAELGWVFTREASRRRGIGRRLLELLLERTAAKNLFATTRLDNLPMQRLLAALEFEPAGQPFYGTGGERVLGLWVRRAIRLGA